MRFMHRIAFRPTPAQHRELEALGVKIEYPERTTLPGDALPFAAFDVGEEHHNWPRLRALFRQWDVSDFPSTEFSTKEINAARWVTLGAWHHGYPQPRELDFGYLEATYDLSDYCSECGVGKKQKAPFQMKGEPKWGRKGILQLNWVFDEVFVTPEVWAGAFKPNGIGCRPVLNTKGVQLKTVVQLTTDERVSIDVAGLPFEACSKCRRVKYLPHTRGFFPPLLAEPAGALVKANEYFGSGASAHQGVLVSQAVVRTLNTAGVRGASFKPLAER
jgi:hypothetical protein